MEKITKLQDFFIQQMRNRLNSIEEQIKFLEKQTKNIETNPIKNFITKNIDVSKKHTKCIKQIFKIQEVKPSGELCEGTQGIIFKANELASRADEKQLIELGILVSVQQLNQFNIVGYQTCKLLAKALEHEEISEVLEEMLVEVEEVVESTTNLIANEINQTILKEEEETKHVNLQ